MKNGRAADAISVRCTRKTSRRIATSVKAGTFLSRKQTPSKYLPQAPPNPPPAKRKSHEPGITMAIAGRFFRGSYVSTLTHLSKKRKPQLYDGTAVCVFRSLQMSHEVAASKTIVQATLPSGPNAPPDKKSPPCDLICKNDCISNPDTLNPYTGPWKKFHVK
jgi:hypothetical protein